MTNTINICNVIMSLEVYMAYIACQAHTNSTWCWNDGSNGDSTATAAAMAAAMVLVVLVVRRKKGKMVCVGIETYALNATYCTNQG